MPTKNRDGRFIISASEVGSYVVCPLAWKLQLDQVTTTLSQRGKAGAEIHDKWAKDVDELYFLTRSIRLIITGVAAAIVIWLFKH